MRAGRSAGRGRNAKTKRAGRTSGVSGRPFSDRSEGGA
ncbi:hypothetical protein [Azospirillum palustre]